MADEENPQGDIIGELTYVITNADIFEKDDMCLVMKSALSHILEMRIELAVLRQAADPDHPDS